LPPFYDEAAAVAAEVAEGIGAEAADLVSSSIGEGAAAEGASISPEAMDSLVEGERVGSALKDDPYHMAPSWADPADIAKNAQQFSIRGYDGFTRTLVQSPGGVNGVTGRWYNKSPVICAERYDQWCTYHAVAQGENSWITSLLRNSQKNSLKKRLKSIGGI
jgi:hypothetical protein